MTDEPGTARVARLFDALADSYDQVGVDFFQPIADGLVAAVVPRRGERWLDVGCGRGAVLVPVARAVEPDGAVLGIDLSPAMVEQCRAVAGASGLANVEVHPGDASAPEVAGPFDGITSSLVLFFLPDPLSALRAWAPLLRAGGRIGVTTFRAPDPRWDAVDEVFAPYLPPAMRDARTSGAQGPFASDAGMERLLADAGFVDVTTRTASVPVRFADAEAWHRFSWSTGQRAMWLSVPEDERPAVRAAAEARLLAHAAPDGSVTFEQNVRHTLGYAAG
jgi:ubiquinone/menaquinone biosynthesis C-methylase UbiE